MDENWREYMDKLAHRLSLKRDHGLLQSLIVCNLCYALLVRTRMYRYHFILPFCSY